jgi:hypothetical protein
MATEAQVQANRSNAQKSTGPRTVEGKAAVSQNAVKHGFSGRLDVIRGEEQAEFDLFREQMLGEWAPAGVMEVMLAERIVSLWWRLKRAERMESEAFEALLTPDTSNLAVRIAQSLRPKRSEAEAEAEGELAFGRAVVKDFGHSRVLDRLLMYERRMEHSLYRTMAELQRLRLVGGLDGPVEEMLGSGAGGAVARAARPGKTRQGQDALATESPAGVTTNMPEEVGRGRPTYEEPPLGVTTNAAGGEPAQHSSIPSFQHSPAAADPAVGPDSSCKTKPIPGRAKDGQVPCGTGVMKIRALAATVKTKPIGGLGIDLDALEAVGRSAGGEDGVSHSQLADDNSRGQGRNEGEKGCLGRGGSVN